MASALGPALAGLQLGLLGTLLAAVSPVNQASLHSFWHVLTVAA